MPKYELTEVTEELPHDSCAGAEATADLIEYGLRSGGTDPEYHLANRLQKLRCVAIELITTLDEEGYKIDPLHLQIIDVLVETKSKKRLTL